MDLPGDGEDAAGRGVSEGGEDEAAGQDVAHRGAKSTSPETGTTHVTWMKVGAVAGITKQQAVVDGRSVRRLLEGWRRGRRST